MVVETAVPEQVDLLYAIRHCPDCAVLNAAIHAQFLACPDDAWRRSHYFGGRFENIYISTETIPALRPILVQAREFAAGITGIGAAGLRPGFWFNAMRPGDVTLPHTHDDDDEVLSAAYYLHVPAHSGDLLVHEGTRSARITPQSGMFVFFAPQCLHEVTRNDSAELRLSLGINFGNAATGVRHGDR
jgi:hypothetical protein